MTGVVRSVLAEALKDAVQEQDGNVVAAVFTTFPLQLDFLYEEALRVLIPHDLSPTPHLRREEIAEHLLRHDVPVAVFHDARHLEPAAGPSRAPVALVGVQHGTGCFHPKVTLLVVQRSSGQQDLVLAVGSANITRAGWWTNVEVAHVSTVAPGSSIVAKQELQAFVAYLRGLTMDKGAWRALDAVDSVLATTRRRQPSRAAEEETVHFLWKGNGGRPDFITQLRDVLGQFGNWYDGGSLEVISPWYSPTGDVQVRALAQLVPVNDVLVALPRDANERRLLPEGTTEVLPAPARWGDLPRGVSRLADADNANWRHLHAKAVRWVDSKGRWETCSIGSVNLTEQAFQRGGNIEAAVVVTRKVDKGNARWLEALTGPLPGPSDQRVEDEEVLSDLPCPAAVTLTYDWADGSATVAWQGVPVDSDVRSATDTVLSVDASEMGHLDSDRSAALQRHLRRASNVLTVRTFGPGPEYTVVTERNVEQKPSTVVRQLADVIASLLAERTGREPGSVRSQLADDLEPDAAQAEDALEEDVLGGYAALYEAVSALQARIVAALDDLNTREAAYRLSGESATSLGALLTVSAEECARRPRYALVVAWAAEALLNQLEDLPHDVATAAAQARKRTDALRQQAEAAVRTESDDPQLEDFLSWGRDEFAGGAR